MKDQNLINIANERITRLFKEAQNAMNEEFSRRYIAVMENLSKRMNVTLPQNIKKSYCKKCKNLYKRPDFRIKNRLIIIKCENCGNVRRIPINQQFQAQNKF